MPLSDAIPAVRTARRRWAVARPFLIVALIAVVAGGLVAAITGPLELAIGSWLAAFLVLVMGVAQGALGVGQALLPKQPRVTGRIMAVELAGWNAGSAAVILGTRLGQVWLVAVGSIGVLAALRLFAREVPWPGPENRRTATRLYWGFVLFVGLSVLVGLVLSIIRHA